MIRKVFQITTKRATNLQKNNFSKLTLELPEYDTYKLDSYELPTHAETRTEKILKTYENMTLLRRLETASDALYKDRLIRGFCHLYDGSEAVIEGIESALTLEDLMITAYRCHGNALKRGETPHSIIAEMMGKRTGGSQGKGGSMHFYSKTHNFFGGNGIVGAQLPVGAGLAFQLKYDKKPNVAVALYGDGASNQGQLFEAANMCYLWKLPMLFVCENNKYAMGTSIDRHAMNTKFYTRGDSIPGIRLNGNNYFHVKEGFKWAKQYAIKNGPLFIEIESYRYHGHSMSDPGLSYRTREEVSEHRKTKDCIGYIKNLILDNNLSTAAELKDIDKKCKKVVDDAVVQAKADPFPVVEQDLYKDIYIDDANHYMRAVEYEQSMFTRQQQE